MIRPSSLRTAARPFVLRALRGRLGRRYAALGLMLSALSVLLGVWISLGTGEFEREIRTELGLEQREYEQQRQRFVLIADGEEELRALQWQVARFARSTGGELPEVDSDAGYRAREAFVDGARLLRAGALAESPRLHRELHGQAIEAWQSWSKNRWGAPLLAAGGDDPFFNWYDRDEVRALESVIARGGVPAVELYASPLSPTDALRLTGALAGGVLIVLLLLVAPVLAGTQVAQETHENTLQPLAGSALRAEELALGLTCGPLAITALIAGPQLIVLLATALAVGDPGAALWSIFAAVAGSAFLVMLAQLAGLALGKNRSPGVVAGGLAALLVMLGGIGLALASEMSERIAGTLALLPQAAASYELAQTFGLGDSVLARHGREVVVDTTLPVMIGALGMLTFAYLGLRALARRIGQTAPSALRGGEALTAAAVAMALVTCANPFRESWRAEEFYLLNLGLLAVPFAILLMMRAPTGDVPPAMRRTPVARLVGEFFAWSALYLAVASGIAGVENVHLLAQPVALLYLLWFLGVTALLSLRIVVAPVNFAARLWVGLCLLAIGVAFAQTAMWARPIEEFGYRMPPLFVFGELSPLLEAVQIVLTVLIPVLLVRGLRRAPAQA